MVWGRSKYHYRLFPPSTKEEDLELEANMVAALDAVTVDEMRRREFFIFYYYFIHEFKLIFTRFSRRSQRFTDAYNRGLTGSEATWANKTYRGHRTLPTTLMVDMEKANLR